jgi:hypothetical protein
VSEESKKKESGWKVNRRGFMGTATGGIVGAALAGVGMAPKPAAATTPLFTPESQCFPPCIPHFNPCGSKECQAVIKYLLTGETEAIDLSGSGGVQADIEELAKPFQFKKMFGKGSNKVGKIKVGLQNGQTSTGTAGQAFVGGQWRNTITGVNLKQTFEFPDANSGAGYTTSPGALNMNINAGNSSTSSLNFNPGSGSLPKTLVPGGSGITLESYDIAVSARPKAQSGDPLLTIEDVTRTSTQLSFRVRKHASVGSVAKAQWWAHDPQDNSTAFPIDDIVWSTADEDESNLVVINLTQWANVNAATDIVIEAASRGDSRKLWAFAGATAPA